MVSNLQKKKASQHIYLCQTDFVPADKFILIVSIII